MSAEESELSAADVERGVKAREYIQFLIDRAMSADADADAAVDPSAGLYKLEFDSGIGLVTWVRTAEELLQANGSEPLVAWMLRESEARGSEVFRLERLPYDGGPAAVAGELDFKRAEETVPYGEPVKALNPIGLVVAADEEVVGQLCEAVHVGLRKGAMGADAHKIWKVIADSETEDWWDGMWWALEALKSEGYVICRPGAEGEVAGVGAGAVVGAAQAWGEGYVAGYDEGNERNTGPMPEGVNPYE